MLDTKDAKKPIIKSELLHFMNPKNITPVVEEGRLIRRSVSSLVEFNKLEENKDAKLLNAMQDYDQYMFCV